MESCFIYNHSCCLVTKLCPTLMIPWTSAHQAPLSMGFPRQENWSGLPFPSPGALPDPKVEPGPPVLQAHSYCLNQQGLQIYERLKE